MKVYLTGRDNVNWALDEDFRVIKSCFLDLGYHVVNEVASADLIYSVNWRDLLGVKKQDLVRLPVIATIPHDLRIMLREMDYLKIASLVNVWTTMNQRNFNFLKDLGMNAWLVRQSIDSEIKVIESRTLLSKKYKLPEDKRIIGSFQRDTEGVDLVSPKLVKGPDVFLEIVKEIYKENENIHVLLAGPRRHWLRRKLAENGIPFTFIGKELPEDCDDIEENNLDKRTINELYNCLDLYIVSSRYEGGPKAIIECLATNTPIISSRVGHAMDFISSVYLYDDPIDAVTIAIEVLRMEKKVFESKYSHSILYNNTKSDLLGLLDFFTNQKPGKNVSNLTFKEFSAVNAKSSIIDKLFKRQLLVSIPYKFTKGPWGGGNQFLKALTNRMKRKCRVILKVRAGADVALVNSFTYSQEDIDLLIKSRTPIVHRIDGPTFLIRGTDKHVDDKMFEFNNNYASISIFQTFWSLLKNIEQGYKPVNPIIINNASDTSVFTLKAPFQEDQKKVKLISTSWSSNKRKGYDDYRILGENLDTSKYSYEFVGRLPSEIKNVELVEPVESSVLNKYLNNSDIYITASINDPCSNSLVEAITTKLPSLYKNSGGHPELVGYGGIGYDNNDEMTAKLSRISENLNLYQNLIVIPDIDDVTSKYFSALELAAHTTMDKGVTFE